jgi:hypothetical protein
MRAWLLAALLLAQGAERPRVVVSTDIGGTDPDDFQSMVHFLLYADRFDIEGLVSSPYGPGRKSDLLKVIGLYERDFPALRRHAAYPEPDRLRSVVRQGAAESPGPKGYREPTEGSRWIVECARRADPRPLYVLVWGGLEDVAQALHDAPDILPKLRVYFIGGPNKMWSVDAYDYIEQRHPGLWMIEANSTYRGWFVGGNQEGAWGNRGFVSAYAAGRGALGAFFASLLNGTLKMGDSPPVGYLLRGAAEDPGQPGWGGRFVRVWEDRKTVFTRLTTEADTAEAFGVVEFALPAPEGLTAAQGTRMIFDGRIPAVGDFDGRTVRFRFSPRDAKVWPYVIESGHPRLNGLSGRFTAALPPAEKTRRVSARHPFWWTDDPDPAMAEGVHRGARHVNRWREDYLRDFAARLERCAP